MKRDMSFRACQDNNAVYIVYMRIIDYDVQI